MPSRMAPHAPQRLPGSARLSNRGPAARGGPGARTFSRCARSRSTDTTWCAVAESRPVVISSRKYTRCGPTSASPARPAGLDSSAARRAGAAGRTRACTRARGGSCCRLAQPGPARGDAKWQPRLGRKGGDRCRRRPRRAITPSYTQAIDELPATAPRSGAHGRAAHDVPVLLTKQRACAFSAGARAGALNLAALRVTTGMGCRKRGGGAAGRAPALVRLTCPPETPRNQPPPTAVSWQHSRSSRRSCRSVARLSRRAGSASAFMNASTGQSTSMPAPFSRRRSSATSAARARELAKSGLRLRAGHLPQLCHLRCARTRADQIRVRIRAGHLPQLRHLCCARARDGRRAEQRARPARGVCRVACPDAARHCSCAPAGRLARSGSRVRAAPASRLRAQPPARLAGAGALLCALCTRRRTAHAQQRRSAAAAHGAGSTYHRAVPARRSRAKASLSVYSVVPRTRAVAGALAARGKVQRLTHGQLRDVRVALLHQRGRAPRLELAQLAPVVRHAPAHLRRPAADRPRLVWPCA